MEKIKLSVLTVFTLIIASSIFYSCSNEEVDTQIEQNIFEDISKMANDEVFTNLIESKINFTNQISNLEKAKELTSKNYALSEIELNELSISLGFSNLNDYINYYEKEKDMLVLLNDKYNIENYDEDLIKSLAIESVNNQTYYRSNNCERVRRNCIIGAAAGATLGHIGCAVTDLTIVVGIVCHAAVAVIQAVVSDTCNADAEDCQND
jgi:hypothetical protein